MADAYNAGRGRGVTAPLRFDPVRLPPEAEALRREARAFLEAETAAGTIGAARESFDRAFSRRVGARGWIGMTWPKRYGGGERSFLERYVVNEEMLAAGAPTQAHFVADRQSGPVLLRYAAEEVKREVLPRIVRGECAFCIGMSEPDSGSDLFAARARAARTADGWRLDGRKVWTSYAHRADYMIGLFRTSPATESDRRHGLSQFLIDMKTPGIEVSPIPFMTGESEFNEVVFEDARLPANALLGEADMAWKQATSELAFERSGPERFLETFQVLTGLVRALGPAPDRRGAEGLGRLAAQLNTLRRMSISVAGMLAAGEAPALEASLVKDLGTNWEQALPAVARDLAAFVERKAGNHPDFDEILAHATMIAPKLTIQGGTREVLRGIVARGLGLR